jgi:cell division protein FtsI/penicillin-binding protein 2
MNSRDKQKGNFEPGRMRIIFILIAGIFLFYAYRLFNLQVVRGDELKKNADRNRTDVVSVQAKRGIIYDRNGYVLARNMLLIMW